MSGTTDSQAPYPPYIPRPTQIARTILIQGALIIDGTGSSRYLSDVFIRSGIIDTLGPEALTRYRAMSTEGDARIIDANGLVLCPGFIDMHAHSDLHLLTHPSHVPKLIQGLTTEIVGKDGIA